MDSHKFFSIGFLLVAGFIQGHGQNPERDPLFYFGVIADVQYADVDQSGKRDYRGSIKRLEKCVEVFNAHDLTFIMHAGDLIDRNYGSYEKPLNIFKTATAPTHYVLGNHEFAVADSLKKNVRRLLNNERGYYAFVVRNIQFVVVDAMDVSLMSSVKGSRDYEKALSVYQDLQNSKANNAFEWNGAIGRRQLKWLNKVLHQGESYGYKSVIFSHLPLMPENGLQLWNNHEVLKLIGSYSSVVAFISGHHHAGGYVKVGHIHHLTLKGLVESRSESACGVVEVYPDKLLLNGFGDQPDYSLEY